MVHLLPLILAAAVSYAQPALEGDLGPVLKAIQTQSAEMPAATGQPVGKPVTANSPRFFVGCKRDVIACQQACKPQEQSEWKRDPIICPRQVIEPIACYCYPRVVRP